MAGFIKLIRDSEESDFLDSKPIESHLLRVIAKRARRSDCAFTGLKSGQALIGDYAKIGISRQQYRTAKSNLVRWCFITINTTNKGTIATLVSAGVYDINEDQPNQQDNQQPTNKVTSSQPAANQQPTTNKECKKVKKVKNVKNTTSTKALDFTSWPNVPSEQILSDYKKLRATRRASFTQTVINSMGKVFNELSTHRVTVDQALSICCERGWQGLKTDWVLNHLSKQTGKSFSGGQSDWDEKVRLRNLELGIVKQDSFIDGEVINHE